MRLLLAQDAKLDKKKAGRNAQRPKQIELGKPLLVDAPVVVRRVATTLRAF